MKRAGIYNPYWDSLGGGERYTAAVVKLLINQGWQVDVWWHQNISQEVLSRFGIDINKANFIPTQPYSNYDLIFWISDGSIPVSLAKKTIIHFQVPFQKSSFLNKLKIRLYKNIVCNSYFTKKFIDKNYLVTSKVIYPPVDIDQLKPLKKQNIIVSIARISRLLHAKRQDVLIEAFIKLHSQLKNWKLILAGGCQDEEYLAYLQRLIGKSPVEIITNPSLAKVHQLLGQAKIFWSATGYGVDANLYPERMEHFGITVVEAMACGTVPIVTACGGHLETVTLETGFLWNTLEELVGATKQITKKTIKLNTMAQAGILRSKQFSEKEFNSKFKAIL